MSRLIDSGDDEGPSPPSPVVDGRSAEQTAPPLVSIRDDFDGGMIDGWEFFRRVDGRWSFDERPGWFTVNPRGFGEGAGAEPENLLLRRPPTGHYEIETYVEFVPEADFQGAGITIVEGPAHRVALLRAVCTECDGRHGVYLDRYDNGAISSDGGHRLEQQTDGVYLRLAVSGWTYSGSYSLDGVTWHSAGSLTKRMSDPWIGLYVRTNDPVAPAAHFDYFEVIENP